MLGGVDCSASINPEYCVLVVGLKVSACGEGDSKPPISCNPGDPARRRSGSTDGRCEELGGVNCKASIRSEF